MALSLDRKAFIDILDRRAGRDRRRDAAAARRGLGHAARDAEDDCPATTPMCEKNRAEARKIMEKLGYGPDKRLASSVSTRNIADFRDPAVILIDQLKEIYIDGRARPDRNRQLALRR